MTASEPLHRLLTAVAWITDRVGLDPGDILLDGDPVAPQKGHSPHFRLMSTGAKRLYRPTSGYHLITT